MKKVAQNCYKIALRITATSNCREDSIKQANVYLWNVTYF